jgi:hypothetical protein
MKIILISKSSSVAVGESLPPISVGDLATASLILNERVSSLKLFLHTKCRLIDEADLQSLLKDSPSLVSKPFIIWKDREQAVFTDSLKRIDWEIILKLWILASSGSPQRNFKEVVAFIENQKMLRAHQSQIIEELYRSIKEFSFSDTQTFNFFNVEKFLKVCKNKAIKALSHNDKVVVEFSDVKLGSDKEGFILYDKIIIFVKDWKIDGFSLRFKEFDYSSYWEVQLNLHPKIAVPICFNDFLSFVPKDYEIFAESIKDAATVYTGTGLATIDQIILKFNDLRKIWNQNKLSGLDRVTLSKQIFNEYKIE